MQEESKNDDMKRVKVVLVIVGIVTVMIAYWYMTSQAGVSSGERHLIVNNSIPVPDVSHAETALTKKQAYEIRDKEIAEQEERTKFIQTNQRPQKLAESVTRAIQEARSAGKPEISAERETTPVYKGQAYGQQGGRDDNEDIPVARPTPNPVVALPIQPAHTTPSRPRSSNNKGHAPAKTSARVVPPVPTPTVNPPPPLAVEPSFNTASFNQAETTEKGNPSVPSGANDTEIIEAAIFGDQAGKPGTLLEFRLLAPAVIDGITYERNTFFSGKSRIGPDRLFVDVEKMPLSTGGYKVVKLTMHDPRDLQEGIPASADPGKEGAVDAASASVESMVGAVGAPGGLAIGSTVAKIARSAIKGSQSVPVSDGEKVIFLKQSR